MTTFGMRTERRNDRYLIELSGELDLNSEPELVAALERAEESDAPVIVVDLGGLEFMDSTGIKILVMAANRLRPSGRLRLLRGPEDIQRVLRIAEVESDLPFVDE